MGLKCWVISAELNANFVVFSSCHYILYADVVRLFKLLIFSIFILKSMHLFSCCFFFFLSVFLHSTLFIDTDFKSDRKLNANVDFP